MYITLVYMLDIHVYDMLVDQDGLRREVERRGFSVHESCNNNTNNNSNTTTNNNNDNNNNNINNVMFCEFRARW